MLRALEWRYAMGRYAWGCFALGCVFVSTPAQACNVEGYDPDVVDYSDAVLVGRVSNYRVVPNSAFSEIIRKSIEDGTAPAWQRARYDDAIAKGVSPGGYYGKFDVRVERVLKGRVPRKMTATYRDWTRPFPSTSASQLPDHLPSQRYLLALVKSDSATPVGRSADAKLPTLLINQCIGPFLMEKYAGMVKGIENYRAWKSKRDGNHPKP